MLTDRQQSAYRFIHDYCLRYGYAPTLTEIADGIGIRSKSVAHRYLKAIADEGLIELIPDRHRGFRLSPYHQDDVAPAMRLPLVGTIAAGKPIEAIQNHDTFDLSDSLLGNDRFMLKVQGDSMIEAGILDGDMVIAEQRSSAMNGDIVIALIENEDATLKYFQKNTDGTITLNPANRTMQPMCYAAARVHIQGVVVCQLRCYHKGTQGESRR